MLSQSRLQRQRLQHCRIYPQVGDKSHWNSRERVLEPEELSFLGGPPTSDTETREGAKRAAEGASPQTYAYGLIPRSRSSHNACIHLVNYLSRFHWIPQDSFKRNGNMAELPRLTRVYE